MLISKKFNFDAAHFLPNYDGKCRNPHGHRWEIEVACSGTVPPDSGMVIDFTILKQFCNTVKEKYDHTSLNNFFPNPTAEIIAVTILDRFRSWCENHSVRPEYVCVWEAPDSMVKLHAY